MIPKEEIEKEATHFSKENYWDFFDSKEERASYDGFIKGAQFAESKLKEVMVTKEDMYSNMQYYMEYCRSNSYVTPMDWIKDHKHY